MPLPRFLRCGLLAGLLAAAPAARAADCLVESASFALARTRPRRLVMMPPRVQVIGDTRGGQPPRVLEGPIMAATLVPEVHCALEALGYEADPLALAGPEAQRSGRASARDVDWAWTSLRALTRKACADGTTLPPGASAPAAVPVAAAVGAEGLVFVQAFALVQGQGARRLARTLETLSSDIRLPGIHEDLTWVEVAIVDGRSGELLVLTAAVVEGRVAKEPAHLVTDAARSAAAVLPARDEPSAWGREIEAQGGVAEAERLAPRCVLSSSKRRLEFERLLERAAGARAIDGADAGD